MRLSAVWVSLIIAVVSTPAYAQSSVPAESMNALQNTFSITRDKLWQINDDFWHKGEFERCIATLCLITQVDPHDTQAYGDGAWLMQNQLRDDEAEAFLLKGLAYNGNVGDLYFELGYFYYIHERFDEAVDCLAIATTFDVPMVVWHTLAHAYEQAGNIEASLGVWDYRREVDPDNPIPQIQIDRILSGGPASDMPRFMSQAREKRKTRAGIK